MLKQNRHLKTILLNFGPQHPAAHGILKISLTISGDIIIRSDSQFGLLHRGSEKLCESRTWSQIIPYMDRMDYVANLIQEHSLVLSIEKLSTTHKTNTHVINSFRTVFDEISRILNHLLTMSALCLDMGAMGPIFWAFEERENIMELCERISGARMHTAMYKPFTINTDLLFNNTLKDILILIQRGARVISGAFLGLLSNRALKSRLAGVGSFSQLKLKNYSISGIIARSGGILIDSRLGLGGPQYSIYNLLSFRTFIGKRGDCYDRFIVRSKEILESYRLITQIIDNFYLNNYFKNSVKQKNKFTSMEGIINHFKNINSPINNTKGLSLGIVEGPKGLVITSIVANGGISPSRVHIKSPVAHNLHLLNSVANYSTFADFVATFCSMDVVLGEIDR